MLNKALFSILSLSLGTFLFSTISYGQTTSTTTTSTTVQETTKKATTSTRKKAVKPAATAKPVDSTTVYQSTTTTTEVKPPPPKEVIHKVYDEEALKKMSKTLCTDGFKAYVGSAKANVCSTRAAAPDIAYSCVWDKDGNPAFAPTASGPCNLDYTKHQGSIVITKDAFKDPPLSYGKEAQCCVRPAKGVETSSSQ